MLQRQVAALNNTLGAGLGTNMSGHPHIKSFLKGVVFLNPPVVHCFPTWDLHLVLNSFMGLHFEPMVTIPLRELTIKTFLGYNHISQMSLRAGCPLGQPQPLHLP